ncbi:hypothetical protein, variant 2 [Aphanomyces astaci]|nr:hypothetical protein, variant 2 [Aphanomyces astaci]ETV75424.1 hypothetical protein, variant 2 [Aphanomyces astaci]|eukprot:XP_009835058.1 hypothetical protein, variant 2 [Aphanomyces astaci]
MTDGRYHSTTKWRASRKDNEQRLNRRGVIIDLSYVIVTAIGVNIFGRVYGAGLQSKRFIVLNVYDPALALNHTMQLSMDELENLFQDHMDLLVAGRKEDLVTGIVAMLYFTYPPDGATPSETPTLHINKHMKISASKLRRQQRERQRQLEAEQKRLDALKFLTMARRQRYRIVARSLKMGGLWFTVTVHQYPNQIRNFAIVAYHPMSGTQYALPVGLHHAGALARLLAPPHQWSKQDKVVVASTVIKHLRLVHNSLGETALAVDGRVGFFNKTLALECAETADSVAEREYRQEVANAVTLVQTACYKQVRELQQVVTDIDGQFQVELKELEVARDVLRAKEIAVKDQLDDVESKGLADVVNASADKETKAQQKQELRDRRQRLKRERADTQTQIKATTQDITTVLAKQQEASAHYQADIKRHMLECEQEVAYMSAAASQPFQFHDKTSGDRRKCKVGYTDGRRHKLEMGCTHKLMAGAATMRDGQRVRYSVWTLPGNQVVFHLYNPTTSGTVHFTCSKLAWCIWSKQTKARDVDLWAIQTQIPAFVVYPQGGAAPNALETQLDQLTRQMEVQSAAYATMATSYSRESAKCFEQLKALTLDKRVLHGRVRQLYHPVASALISRLSVTSGDQVDVNTLLLVMPQVDVVTSKGDSKSCACEIHLDGTQIVYEIDHGWKTQVHPYTDELMAEFATESAAEMKVHMELTLATMQLTYPEATTEAGSSGVVLEFLD